MLVYPVMWCEDFLRYNDIAHGIFFEDTTKGFEYMEEMNDKNDGSVYYYWSNLLMEYKKSDNEREPVPVNEIIQFEFKESEE